MDTNNIVKDALKAVMIEEEQRLTEFFGQNITIDEYDHRYYHPVFKYKSFTFKGQGDTDEIDKDRCTYGYEMYARDRDTRLSNIRMSLLEGELLELLENDNFFDLLDAVSETIMGLSEFLQKEIWR